MFRKKTVLFVIAACIAVVFAVLLLFGPQTAGENAASEDETGGMEYRAKQISNEEDGDEKNGFSQKQQAQLSSIFGKTYIYYDEFQPGKPVTYTFYDNGTMVAYYWEDTEGNSIPVGSQWAKCLFNEDITEITLEWDDGTKITDRFEIKSRSVVIGDAEFKISDREIHLN